jgi:hypothetical protein
MIPEIRAALGAHAAVKPDALLLFHWKLKGVNFEPVI